MSENPHHVNTVTLPLSSEERWTLHHVLLDRIEQESTAVEPSIVDPPPVEVFQAFEALDDGETSFTIEQLEAVQTTLAEYHHSTTWWETERSQLERLLNHVARPVERHHAAPASD